jgi:hypothetical protein
MVTAADLNKAFLQLPKRAEANEPSKLVDTFVDTGNLLTLLSSVDHQVIYGRRGTGKTHALVYLTEKSRKQGDVAIYIDMRTIGSSGNIYGDPSLPLSERGTRLLADALTAVHETLLRNTVERSDLDLARLGPVLDRLADQCTAVEIKGTVDREQSFGTSSEKRRTSEGALSLGKDPSLKMSRAELDAATTTADLKVTERGALRHRIHFGALGKVLGDLIDQLDGKRLWIVLDEWSSIPLDLQPYLADLIRRSFFPVRGITVKIGAIEQRSRFKLPTEAGDYVGIELGADASADINLDDFMVFGNDATRAHGFFLELLFRHARAVLTGTVLGEFETAAQLRQIAFTQRNAFDEFVRAAEGVPRDAINIIALAALKAGTNPLSVHMIRDAAKNWYQRDKENAVGAHTPAHRLLNWIIDEVIGHRRARAFLLRSDVSHNLIDTLFDARVLHVLKRTVSAKDQPGVRFKVYALDFGCYVDLITTAKAPQALLRIEVDGSEELIAEVPPDDYRSIRGAVLDLEQFEKSLQR